MNQHPAYAIISHLHPVPCHNTAWLQLKPQKQEPPKEEVTLLESELDTFYLGNRLVEVEQITEGEFDHVSPTRWDTSEARCLSRDSALVQRVGDTLFFTAADTTVILVNNLNEDDDQYAQYSYMGHLKEMNQCVVYGIYYESHIYLLVDMTSGNVTYIRGVPVLSPDKKRLICGNADLQAGFTDNGLELYKYDGKLIPEATRELEKRGPEEVRWAGNKTLLVQVDLLDSDQSVKTYKTYIRLKLR